MEKERKKKANCKTFRSTSQDYRNNPKYLSYSPWILESWMMKQVSFSKCSGQRLRRLYTLLLIVSSYQHDETDIYTRTNSCLFDVQPNRWLIIERFLRLPMLHTFATHEFFNTTYLSSHYLAVMIVKFHLWDSISVDVTSARSSLQEIHWEWNKQALRCDSSHIMTL